MRLRYLCRFLNPDPSGFSGGLNFYGYADGNPVSYLDPFGLCTGDEPSAGYWVGVGMKATAGWAYDQVYGVGAQLSSVLFSALGTGLDMLGQGYLNDPGLGRDLHKWAEYDWENQTPAANAGWYDSSQPGYKVASLSLILFTRNPETAAVKTTAAVDQYTLKAVEDGFYPVMKRGFAEPQGGVWLNAGDVWKYGTTKNPATRYSELSLGGGVRLRAARHCFHPQPRLRVIRTATCFPYGMPYLTVKVSEFKFKQEWHL